MDSLKFKGDLNIAKGKLKQKWAKLTRDDFQLLEGKQDETMGLMQKRAAAAREATKKANTKPGSMQSTTERETPGVAAPRNPTELT
jgi:uncharacterized protein YjbJ (UPF0337 family)